MNKQEYFKDHNLRKNWINATILAGTTSILLLANNTMQASADVNNVSAPANEEYQSASQTNQLTNSTVSLQSTLDTQSISTQTGSNNNDDNGTSIKADESQNISSDIQTSSSDSSTIGDIADSKVNLNNNFANGSFTSDELITVSGELIGPFKAGDSLQFNLPVGNINTMNGKSVTFNGAEAYGDFTYDITSGIATFTFNKDFPIANTPIKFNLNWSAVAIDTENNVVSANLISNGEITQLSFTNGLNNYNSKKTDVQPTDLTNMAISPTNGFYPGTSGAGNENYIQSGTYLPTGQMTFSTVLTPGSSISGLTLAKDRQLVITPTNGGTLGPEDIFYPYDSVYIPLTEYIEKNDNLSYTTNGKSVIINFKDGYNSSWYIINMILKNATDLNANYGLHFQYLTSTSGPWWETDVTLSGTYQNNSSKGFIPNIQGNKDKSYYVGQNSKEQIEKNLIQGITVNDVEDGDLSGKVKVDDSSLNTDLPGKYTVTFEVTDSDGNVAKEASDVIMKSNQKSITGESYSLHVGDSTPTVANFNATATDIDGNPESVFVDLSGIDMTKAGVYEVKLSTADGQNKTVKLAVLANQKSINGESYNLHVGDNTPTLTNINAAATDIDGNPETNSAGLSNVDTTVNSNDEPKNIVKKESSVLPITDLNKEKNLSVLGLAIIAFTGGFSIVEKKRNKSNKQ